MKKYSDMSAEQMADLIGDGTFSLKERMRVSIMTKTDRGWPAYDGTELDRRKFVTASEAESCLRKLAFDKMKPAGTLSNEEYWDSMSDEDFKAHLLDMGNDDKRGIFERGNVMEEWIVSMLMPTEQPGEEFLFMGKYQRSFYTKKLRLSGTPDGVFVNHETKTIRVLEYKTVGTMVSSPRNSHVTQVQMNAGLIEYLLESGELAKYFPGLTSDYKVEGVNLLYVDVSNWLDMREFKLNYDAGEAFAAAFKTKASKLWYVKDGKMHMRHPNELPAEGIDKWNGCMFCSHKKDCLRLEAEAGQKETAERVKKAFVFEGKEREVPKMPEFKSDMTQENVAKLAAEYEAARQAEKEGKALKERVKKALSPWLEEQTDKTADFTLDGVHVKVALSDVNKKGGLDMTAIALALTKAGLDLETFREEGSTSTSFNVTVKEASA